MRERTSKPARSFWQRWKWRVRTLALLVVGGVAFLTIQACSMPGPVSSAEQITALERASTNAANANLLLSYLRAGDAAKPRIIYIHGTPGTATGWADYLVTPVPGFEAIAVDRLGFGQSAGQRGGVDSFLQQAEAIAPLLVEREGRWPILVGHSLGGPIAAQIAAMHPGKVGGLIIVAGSLDPALEEPGLGQMIATTGLVRFFLPRILDNSMGELAAAKRETTLLGPELAKITCPVVIIHGTVDELVSYDNVAYMQKMLVNAKSVRVVTLTGQGHFVPWERAAEIRRAVGGEGGKPPGTVIGSSAMSKQHHRVVRDSSKASNR